MSKNKYFSNSTIYSAMLIFGFSALCMAQNKSPNENPAPQILETIEVTAKDRFAFGTEIVDASIFVLLSMAEIKWLILHAFSDLALNFMRVFLILRHLERHQNPNADLNSFILYIEAEIATILWIEIKHFEKTLLRLISGGRPNNLNWGDLLKFLF